MDIKETYANSGIGRWFREKWTDQYGKECGSGKSYKRGKYPKCRPSRKVSGKTPQTWGEMSKKDKIKAIRRKQKARGKMSSHLSEENKPTDPDLWARAKAAVAKGKLRKHSLYKMAAAAKWYKARGGGWRSTNESVINEVADKESMPCNKPRASTSPGKKMMVKACEGGEEKIVHFGAKGYGHNYSKAARRSFRARHKCGEKKSKLSAQYWACKKLWAGKGGSTAPCPEGRQCKESFEINNNIITESKMTPERKKLIKKMVRGIKRENPKYSKSRSYAIATAQSAKATNEALNNFKNILLRKELSEEIVNPDNVPMSKREIVVRDSIAKKRKLRKWCKAIKGKDNAKNAYHRCATFIVMKMRGGKKGASGSSLDKAERSMSKRNRDAARKRAKRAAGKQKKG
jgi:hypothetical protein